MKAGLIALISTAVVLAPNAASAKPALDENFIPPTLTFEAPADHYREWKRPLPCPSGHFKTRITVFNPAEHAGFQAGAVVHFWDNDHDQTGTTFRFETWKHVLPLRAAIMRMETDEITLAPGIYKPGQSIDLEISWTGSRSFEFLVDGRTTLAMTTQRPVAWFNLVGVGSRTIFDRNELQCDLIS